MVREIKLRGINDVKELNRIATSFPEDVGIHTQDAIVDAKSLLGLLSLNYKKDSVYCVTEDERFYKRIRQFLA